MVFVSLLFNFSSMMRGVAYMILMLFAVSVGNGLTAGQTERPDGAGYPSCFISAHPGTPILAEYASDVNVAEIDQETKEDNTLFHGSGRWFSMSVRTSGKQICYYKNSCASKLPGLLELDLPPPFFIFS